MTYYLSLDEVLRLHSKTVEISGGGSSEILNKGQIESILEHIKNDAKIFLYLLLIIV